MKNKCSVIRRYGVAMLAVCASLFTAALKAEEWTDPSGNVWTVTVSGDKARVTAVKPKMDDMPYELVIPSEVTIGAQTVTVTAFNSSTFSNKSYDADSAYMSGITIPETITEIPAEAFFGCGRLERVTIEGEGLTAVGNDAFQGCFSLRAIALPDSVTTIGLGVFSKCNALAEATLGNGLTALPGVANSAELLGEDVSSRDGGCEESLFFRCRSLKTVNIGTNVTAIGEIAFLDCAALENINIPDSVLNIESHAFVGCSNLVNVAVGTNLVAVQDGAFRTCVKLTSFNAPDSLQSIGAYAFAGCSSLSDVSIPENRDGHDIEIGYSAFASCSSLKI